MVLVQLHYPLQALIGQGKDLQRRLVNRIMKLVKIKI